MYKWSEFVMPGNPLQSISVVVLVFFSKILSYFCFFVLAFKPCHGKLPRRKYRSTYPNDSKSSRLDCSIGKKNWKVNQKYTVLMNKMNQEGFIPIPTWVFIDAYLAVPVKFFPSRNAMCLWVLGSLYIFASPKSITYTMWRRDPLPSKKLSGFISLIAF